MNIFKKLILYFHTIKYLKLIQIYYRIIFFIKNRFLKSIFIIIIIINIKKYKQKPEILLLKNKIKSYNSCSVNDSKYEFVFLNKKVPYQDTIIWNDGNQEKLWLYNLHYFDYLFQINANYKKEYFTTTKRLILSWIENNPTGKGVGWESYPLSLRIVNWIYFYNYYSKQINNDIQFKSILLENLFKQCEYLTYFIEYHLMANHLFKNAKALFIAGLFFNHEKWQKLGSKILVLEIKEQILHDGGYFERSPMYHAITLEDILDLINFSKNRNDNLKNLFKITELEEIAQKMLQWLEKVNHPDGEIPLIGDSAFKIAPNFESLKEYYKCVTGTKFNSTIDSETTSLLDSGYFVFRSEDQYMIADAGELGVRYQPGHAHCGLLSFEYSYKKYRVFVDSGIGNYLKSDLRNKARSIRSHNTVMVNNMEQGEVWAAFRMGRRVNPNKAKIYTENNVSKFSVSYENKLNLKLKYKHKREIELFENKFFVINDYINSKNIKSVYSFFHLSPDVRLSQVNSNIEINLNNNIICLYIKHFNIINVRDWFYTPEFGKKQNSKVIVIEPAIEKLTSLTYIICPKIYKSNAENFIQKNWKQ